MESALARSAPATVARARPRPMAPCIDNTSRTQLQVAPVSRTRRRNWQAPPRRRRLGVAPAAAAADGRDSDPATTTPATPRTAADADGPTIPLPIFLPPETGPMPDVDARERELLYLTDAEALERVDSAAGLLSVLDDLRPLDRKTYSSSEEVWRAIADIPPPDRVRLLDALDAGGCRQMWRHTVGRYALSRERAEALFRGHTVWRDLPPLPADLEEIDEEDEEEEEVEEQAVVEAESGGRSSSSNGSDEKQPGRRRRGGLLAPMLGDDDDDEKENDNDPNAVVEFDGVCERLVVESVPLRATRPGDKNPIDLPPPGSAAADLRPRPGRALRRVRRFRLQVFRHARTGQPYARLVLPNALSSALTAEQMAEKRGERGGGAGGGDSEGNDWLAALAAEAREGPSCYCRLDLGLALTPVRRDAGAELTLAWPSPDDPDLGGLTRWDLPPGKRWPAPERWSDDWKKVRGGRKGGRGWLARLLGGGGGGEEGGEKDDDDDEAAAEGWSPFSWTDRDYVRPAGPGVYVGCGYRPTQGLMVEDQFVWFVLARRYRDEEEEEEEGGGGDEDGGG